MTTTGQTTVFRCLSCGSRNGGVKPVVRQVFTGVYMETASDAPPVNPEPLIYVTAIEDWFQRPAKLDGVAYDPELARALELDAMTQRAAECGFQSTLTLMFAFAGDLPVYVDNRG